MQSTKTEEKNSSRTKVEKPKIGIAVDGFCLGNPGGGGYKGIDIATGKVLFNITFKLCTNNIAEYCACVHGLMYAKKEMIDGQVWSDSNVAIGWVTKKSSNTAGPFSKLANSFLTRCDRWLIEQKSYNNIMKWETKKWGEIPADFNNK